MSLLAKFLHVVTARMPMRVICVNHKPYLERYHVCSFFGRKVWLHCFVRNDMEDHLHDHPWSATSVILTGEYTEVIPADDGVACVNHRAPGINRIPAAKQHRIIYVKPGTWSLMFVGRRHGHGWHFYDRNGKVLGAGQSGADDWYKTAENRADTYRYHNYWDYNW